MSIRNIRKPWASDLNVVTKLAKTSRVHGVKVRLFVIARIVNPTIEQTGNLNVSPRASRDSRHANIKIDRRLKRGS